MRDPVAKGGHRIGERFFAPTVVADANATILCVTEETLGPFAPVLRFHTEQEAIDASVKNGMITGIRHGGH